MTGKFDKSANTMINREGAHYGYLFFALLTSSSSAVLGFIM